MFTNKMPKKNPVPELAVAALTAAMLRKYLHLNRNRFSRYSDYGASFVGLQLLCQRRKIIAMFVNKVKTLFTNMAMIFGADVIAVSQRVTCHNPNIVRIGCDSNEDIFFIRLV